MSLPNVLLIGKNGQVGWELRRTLAPMANVTAIDFPDIDLTNHDSIRHWVRESKPDVIINAAAYTAVDKAETEIERAMAINGTAPGLLAEESKRMGALLVHYSTDYVFDGTKNESYLETDVPNPLSAYGKTKLAGDKAICECGGSHLIFRLCWVYGARGQNFMLTMMRLARERETLRVVADQTGSPTWSRMIAQATTLAVSKALSSGDPARYSGIYHLAASGLTTWHGFAAAIVDSIPAATRKCQAVQPISTAEYPTPAKRPAYSGMNCDKLEKTFGVRLPHWRQSLEAVLEN